MGLFSYDAPTTDTDAPTTDTDAPTTDTDAPTMDTDAPTTDTDAPTMDIDAPTMDIDAPTMDTDGKQNCARETWDPTACGVGSLSLKKKEDEDRVLKASWMRDNHKDTSSLPDI